MQITRSAQSPRRQGYTLVELLLTTSLLLLFAGLAVVSMETLNQGSTFGEGTTRFETMVRYAHAEAARTGRRVRLDFFQETNSLASLSGTNQLNQVRLSWEPNPATEPDVFQDLTGPRWGVEQVNEAVRVADVRLVDSTPDPATNAVDGLPDASAIPGLDAAGAATDPDSGYVPAAPSALTFNPDGSCDAADITLVGLAPEEDHRIILRVDGLTGEVKRRPAPPVGDTNTPPALTNSASPFPESRPLL
jgi:hypothetical protein